MTTTTTAPTITELPEDRHWWFASRVRALFAVSGALAGKRLRVLDVGCGAGNMMHHLARFGPVQGVEIDARPLKLAQARGYEVKLADAGAAGIPHGDAQFDLVTALDVIEHTKDDVAVLKECARVLAPGGFALVTVPAFMFLWSRNDELNAHERRYTAGELRRKLEAAGFTTRRVTYNNFFVFPLAALLLLMRRGTKNAPDLRSHHTSTEEYQVEMEPASPPVNAALTLVGKLEAGLLGAMDLPWGTSLIALAQKRTQ